MQPPEQLDAGLAASSQPVVAAGDGGKLAIGFISGGSLFTTVKPAANQPYSPLQLVASPALNPSIDLSINDVGVRVVHEPGGRWGRRRRHRAQGPQGDGVRDRPSALDIAATNGAGLGTGRSRSRSRPTASRSWCGARPARCSRGVCSSRRSRPHPARR